MEKKRIRLEVVRAHKDRFDGYCCRELEVALKRVIPQTMSNFRRLLEEKVEIIPFGYGKTEECIIIALTCPCCNGDVHRKIMEVEKSDKKIRLLTPLPGIDPAGIPLAYRPKIYPLYGKNNDERSVSDEKFVEEVSQRMLDIVMV